MKKILKKEKGQSLVEVVIAMTILIVATTAAMAVVVSSKNLLYISEGQTKATALAQEGIEIVRSNRNIGCSFNNLSTDDPTKQNESCHTIWSDMVLPGDTDNSNNQIKPITDFANGKCSDATPPNQIPNKIDNFDGFTRVIYLYDLANTVYDGWAKKEPDVSTGFGADGTFDGRDKYYIVKVKVFWKDKTGDRSTVITTIMLKRWKD